MRLVVRGSDVSGAPTGAPQRWHRSGGRFERDEVKCGAVDSQSGGIRVITLVGVVHMGMRRVTRGESMNAVSTFAMTMCDPRRPANLERQYGEQEQQDESFHGVGV